MATRKILDRGGHCAGREATESSLVHRLETCVPAGQAMPTVVLVHGAWADASGWSGEVSRLQAAGYDVRAIAQAGFPLRTGS